MLTTRSQQKRQHLSDPIETSDGRNKKRTRNEISKDGDRNDVPKTLNTYTASSSVEDHGTSSESNLEEASEESDEDSVDGMGVLDDRRINALAFVAIQNDNNAGGVVNDENDGQVERVAGAGQIGRRERRYPRDSYGVVGGKDGKPRTRCHPRCVGRHQRQVC